MKRARYDGPYTAVDVRLPDGSFVTVERGHLLPTEHEGQNIPASLRDELTSRDDWTEVTQSTTSAAKSDGGKEN